jgi:hypothetical protein
VIQIDKIKPRISVIIRNDKLCPINISFKRTNDIKEKVMEPIIIRKHVIEKENIVEKKIQELFNILSDEINVNVVIKTSTKRNIDVEIQSKINGKEIIHDSLITKNKQRHFVIEVNNVVDEEIENKLNGDEPTINMPKKLIYEPRKIPKEEIVEELICHGDALDELKDIVNENMLGDDYSLKIRIEKNRKLYNEKNPFKEKKLAIEEFSKTNVKCMLENRKTMIDIEEKKRIRSD